MSSTSTPEATVLESGASEIAYRKSGQGAPLLLIHGWPVESHFSQADAARCRGLVAIPGARLLPHEERPELVSQAVLEFFQR